MTYAPGITRGAFQLPLRSVVTTSVGMSDLMNIAISSAGASDTVAFGTGAPSCARVTRPLIDAGATGPSCLTRDVPDDACAPLPPCAALLCALECPHAFHAPTSAITRTTTMP